ncbi:MAG: hypothetical protein K2K68_04090 [Duncaniella sp.]|nr:hypothetical protein [Duncaniella sp.]
MNHAIRFLLSLLVLASAAACHDNDPGAPNELDAAWTLATFTGTIDGHATFEFRKDGDSPLITLTAQGEVQTNDNLRPQSRVYIAYVPQSGDPYSSGPITLLTLSTITSSAVSVADAATLAGWDTTPVYLLTAWRSGEYINIYCRLPYDKSPRRFALLADETTIDTPRPQLYLCHEMPREVNTFMRAYYASFDISSLLSRTDVEAVDVHINNSNLPVTVYTFPIDR